MASTRSRLDEPMSRVALVTSIEVFITLFLGALFLRRREAITPALLGAAALGVAGTACVIVWDRTSPCERCAAAG